MDILYEIQKKYNDFSDKEKAIADYIMQLTTPSLIMKVC